MTIQAKRFSMLGRETNLPVADFLSSMGSDVMNSAENALSEISDAVKSLVDGAKQSDAFAMLSDLKDNATRMARDAISSMKDIAKWSENAITDFINDLLPGDNIFKRLFATLSSRCKKAAAGGINFGSDFDIGANCGNAGGRSGCDSAQFNNILNGLSGGLLGDMFRSAGKMINAIMSLAKIGFDLGVCGVLSALSGMVGGDKNILGLAAGSLFGTLGANGNTKGIFSLAGDAVSMGINAAKSVPGAVGMAINNFNPKGIVSGAFDRFSGSMEILSGDNWNKGVSGALSVADYAGKNIDYALAAGKSALTGKASLSSWTMTEDASYAAAASAKTNLGFQSKMASVTHDPRLDFEPWEDTATIKNARARGIIK